MIVLQGHPLEWEVVAPTAVTVGVFDGVHIGHRRVISDLVASARGESLLPTAVTFHPHPLTFLAPERAPLMLTSLEQRVEQFQELGVAVCGVLHFPDIRYLSPESFAVDVLATSLGARKVVVGADFRFGRDRGGDAGTLTELGDDHGFTVEVVDMFGHLEGVVSSTRIRNLLLEGKVEEAATLLARPFELEGRVEAGDGRGRTLGIPTANLNVDRGRLIPGNGVYAGRARLGERDQLAVINVGSRPTFAGEGRRVEAHLLDFQGDLYGQSLRLTFEAHLRVEQKFESVEALQLQIEADISLARQVLSRT
ncbi:MAG TPA: bifunctional riboflavin kinase/FAD synthetase [Acidimicrobiia bacterium]|nr:bifunctional riboflavin kinase/FAD synthetase [Acidimicrobiia bacterium]